MIRHRTINMATLLLIFISIITAAGGAVILRWAYQSSDVLEIKNSPFPVRTIREHPTADGVVFLKVNYCKKSKAEGRVIVSFVSQSQRFLIPWPVDNQPPVCQEVEVPVPIPKDLPPDKYKIHFRTEYKVNPLKEREVEEFESVEFEIVPNNGGSKVKEM